MVDRLPALSIGLPVRNGERFLVAPPAATSPLLAYLVVVSGSTLMCAALAAPASRAIVVANLARWRSTAGSAREPADCAIHDQSHAG